MPAVGWGVQLPTHPFNPSWQIPLLSTLCSFKCPHTSDDPQLYTAGLWQKEGKKATDSQVTETLQLL